MRLAIYHLSVRTISRSAGRSATAAIAYRAGERIADHRTGLIHDYSRRSGVEHAEIFTPENAPAWARDRELLWNAAEQAENRKNSTVAREFVVALPTELNSSQRLALVRSFAQDLVHRHGMAVDVAVHTPGREGDDRNHHAHVLCSTRRLSPDGFKDKTRELDAQKSGEIDHWRSAWAKLANDHLAKAGHQSTIDHRSLAAQRELAQERGDLTAAAVLNRAPTIHLGPHVVQMEHRGVTTDRGNTQRAIHHHNAQIIDLAEVRKRIESLRSNDHERTDGNRRAQPASRNDGLSTRRAGMEQPSPGSAKPDLARLGRVPPPFARGRLRNLSQLGVVRFTERSEVLLPSHVPGDVEHQGAQRDNALRRDNNQLGPPSTQLRDKIQNTANKALLRTLEAPQIPSAHADLGGADSEKIKLQWQAEKAQQFSLVAAKAQRVHGRASGQMARQEIRLVSHERERPTEPSGFLANLKRAAHEQAVGVWRGVRSGLEKRFTQLSKRLAFIGDYMRQADSSGLKSRGERLAEQKAAHARPELAATFQQVIEREKASALAHQRAKIESRQKKRQERVGMKQETNEELKQRLDANRIKAEQTERKTLVKAGREAALQSPLDAEQKYELDQTSTQQADRLASELNAGTDKGDRTREERRKEILERFKEKAQKDRDNGGHSR